jgi:hypothetical protein
LNPIGRFWEEFERISQVASRLSLEHDVVISALPVDLDDLRAQRTPFLLNVSREGTPG